MQARVKSCKEQRREGRVPSVGAVETKGMTKESKTMLSVVRQRRKNISFADCVESRRLHAGVLSVQSLEEQLYCNAVL